MVTLTPTPELTGHPAAHPGGLLRLRGLHAGQRDRRGRQDHQARAGQPAPRRLRRQARGDMGQMWGRYREISSPTTSPGARLRLTPPPPSARCARMPPRRPPPSVPRCVPSWPSSRSRSPTGARRTSGRCVGLGIGIGLGLGLRLGLGFRVRVRANPHPNPNPHPSPHPRRRYSSSRSRSSRAGRRARRPSPRRSQTRRAR